MTALQAAALIRAGKTSSAELVEQALARIAALDGKLNAFITVTEYTARLEAKKADEDLAAGKDRGPLHGIPIAVKDLFSTRGVRTTDGSKIFENYVPDQDAAVVEKLAAAGAVLVGKTNMHELALGITSNNPHFGAVHNPWDLERIPGGSSGGSGAAVAAGIVPVAMGSDTGGSIRIPASYCGCVGLKPTYGRVSRRGALPLSFSLDHMGPLAATVRDAAVVLNAIAGYDPGDNASSRRPVEDYVPAGHVSLEGVRIGLPENFYFEGVEPAVEEAVRNAAALAARLGARVAPVQVPDIAAVNTIGRVIQYAEASAFVERYLGERGNFGADVLALFDQGRLLPATDYVHAQRLRRIEQRKFAALWRSVDFLFAPSTPNTAPLIGQDRVVVAGQEEDVRLAATRLVRGLNVLGVPAISIPCGFDPAGLPMGLQIVGPPFGEAALLRVAAALEDALELGARVPSLIRS